MRLPKFKTGDRVEIARFGRGSVVADQAHVMKGLYLIALDLGWDIQYLADNLARTEK